MYGEILYKSAEFNNKAFEVQYSTETIPPAHKFEEITVDAEPTYGDDGYCYGYIPGKTIMRCTECFYEEEGSVILITPKMGTVEDHALVAGCEESADIVHVSVKGYADETVSDILGGLCIYAGEPGNLSNYYVIPCTSSISDGDKRIREVIGTSMTFTVNFSIGDADKESFEDLSCIIDLIEEP